MTPAETALFTRLETKLLGAQIELELLNAYYEGAQRLVHLGLAVPPELRVFQVVVNWPRVAVDAVEERLDIEGFRFPGADGADDDLWAVWQANAMDEQSQLGHVDALALRRAYVAVGTNEADRSTPLITVESPREMVAEIDPRTRKVRAALKVYDVQDGRPSKATLYQPDATVWLEHREGAWGEVDRDTHALGAVPVVPLVNRPRLGDLSGSSEMADVIGLTDAACRALTNLQVAQETHAVPQRGVLGASKGDFVDQDGNPLPVWQAYFGALWALENSEAKTFQFTASDLRNFHETVNHYAALVASVTGLPMRYLGQNTANPPSADAIRADEARLVKRCERKQRAFGGAWEDVMRLALRLRGDALPPTASRLETVWRDPATPTVAQQADAAVKLYAAGITTRRQVREDVGYSAAQIERMERDDTSAADRLLAGDLASALAGPR